MMAMAGNVRGDYIRFVRFALGISIIAVLAPSLAWAGPVTLSLGPTTVIEAPAMAKRVDARAPLPTLRLRLALPAFLVEKVAAHREIVAKMEPSPCRIALRLDAPFSTPRPDASYEIIPGELRPFLEPVRAL